MLRNVNTEANIKAVFKKITPKGVKMVKTKKE